MNKATFKFYIRKDQINSEGEAPVYLRITINRKHKYLATGIYLLPKYWNATLQTVTSTTPNAQELDLYFSNYKTNIKRTILNLQNSKKTITFSNILPQINYRNQGYDFIKFCEEWLEKNPDDLSEGTIIQYVSHLANFKKKYTSVPIHQIDRDFVSAYCEHLKTHLNQAHSILNNIAFIRRMWRMAKKKYLSEDTPNPFIGLSIPKGNEKHKAHLTYAERQILIDALDGDILSASQKKLLLPFLIGCYTGLRYSDWAQANNIVNKEIVVYQTKKGGKRKPKESLLYIPITPNSTLEHLLKKLPTKIQLTSISNYTRQLVMIMAKLGIDKKITTHCARHTFVVMCLNEAQIDLGMTAELIGDNVKTLMQHYAQYVTAGKRKAMSKLLNL